MGLVLTLAKLLVAALGMLASYVSALLFKGTAVLTVTLLRIIQLPGCAVSFSCAPSEQARSGPSLPSVPPPSKPLAGDERRSEYVKGHRVSSNSAATRSIVEVAKGRPEVLLNAATELFEYAWEVAKNTVISSTESLLDAVRYVFKHARA